jgi:hypothetical protein
MFAVLYNVMASSLVEIANISEEPASLEMEAASSSELLVNFYHLHGITPQH